jgi:hypothetical protein
MHCSQASLKHVEHVELYIHPLEDFICSGILIQHYDGLQEALGQRRVGLPGVETTTISRPSQIHYQPFRTADGHERLKIMFSTSDGPGLVDSEKSWHSRPMLGTATWSFNWIDDVLRLSDAE